MAKKEYGTCCICGQEKELTFEHIPPKAAFNRFSLKKYDYWDYLLHNKTRYQQAQKGAGLHSLCSSCNNNTGEWYGAAYAEFAVQGMQYYNNNAQGKVSVPYTIYPLRVLKQIVSCFASVNGAVWCEQNPSIRSFLLNPHERNFPEGIDILIYMQTGKRFKIDKLMGQMNMHSGERFFGSEWAFPPFSYICVYDKHYSNYKVLRELCSIMPFLKYGYDDRTTLYLNIPRKPCNPTTLDFREGIPDFESFIQARKNEQ